MGAGVLLEAELVLFGVFLRLGAADGLGGGEGELVGVQAAVDVLHGLGRLEGVLVGVGAPAVLLSRGLVRLVLGDGRLAREGVIEGLVVLALLGVGQLGLAAAGTLPLLGVGRGQLLGGLGQLGVGRHLGREHLFLLLLLLGLHGLVLGGAGGESGRGGDRGQVLGGGRRVLVGVA